MKKTILFFLASLFFSQLNFAQDGVVNDANEAEAEFHVAINPLDSNNMIVATIHGFSGTSNITIYYTRDFGLSWEASTFHGFYTGMNNAGDPVVNFDDQGNAYLVNLTLSPNFGVLTLLSKSTDGGETWTFGAEVAGGSDKPWLAVDRNPASPAYGNIYVPTVIDAGPNLYVLNDTFDIIGSSPVNGGDHLPSIAVKNNGDVFIGSVGISDPNEIYISQFTNGGTQLVHSTMLVSFPDFTFNSPDVSNRFQPTVYVAVDNSGGTYDGRLYVAYTASESGNSTYFDVYLMTSDDDGVTWSSPTPVHADLTTNVQQFYSSLFVNDQGVLMIDWYDRRNYPSPDRNTDFFLGISHDGGDSFEEVQLNSESMDFQYTALSNQGFGIGEYHQLVATDHTAICFWADGRTNDQDVNIYMAKVNIDNPMVSIDEMGVISDQISISALYPNPIDGQINLDIELQKSYKLQSIIMDIDGKQLWTSDWEDYSLGKHQLSYPCDLSSGTYLFQVKSDKGFFKTTKFIKL